MAWNIFKVNASMVNTNGQYSGVSGFPKTFSSESYDGSTDKALRRAKAALYSWLGNMYAVDNWQMITATIEQANGQQVMRVNEGTRIEPTPEPEPEPEGEEEPEGGEGGEEPNP